ncbi:hypothetical protein [Streptomyces sp. NBC_01361]|uniref:hypothetical protein n=1 Tax=Streptomyces sp. NBC_01361 TaxID=2903838 RepID=UPI002E305349|nr:hypothetical protein [Streptomyces sp. NBC_01361]
MPTRTLTSTDEDSGTYNPCRARGLRAVDMGEDVGGTQPADADGHRSVTGVLDAEPRTRAHSSEAT